MSDRSTDGSSPDPDEQRRAVRSRYGTIAAGSSTGCCGSTAGETADIGCCTPGGSVTDTDDELAETTRQLGYDDTEMAAVGPGANLGLGCGNPTAIASLKIGQTVLDLGSGGGFDCFLAAREVGSSGQVLGVDMTPEMVERARENARQNDAENVSFRLGEIEHLPVADRTVDVIISNCVINLSPNKSQVFQEAFRVLRPGGRLTVSDVVRSAELPADVAADLDAISACVGGAATIDALEAMLDEAGFVDVAIEPKDGSREFISEWSADHDPSEYAVSATITARKPEPTQQNRATGA